MIPNKQHIAAIIPAAGVGKRMAADKPKQYLLLNQQTILEHTVALLLSHPAIDRVVVVLGKDDIYFNQLPLASHSQVSTVTGGAERVNSVMAGLASITEEWVMVHDAARPCVSLSDIDNLIVQAQQHPNGAILASPVRDTMKRAAENGVIEHTVCREHLWHALTPQMFRTESLKIALQQAMQQGVNITDEASAMEHCGLAPMLVRGRSDNIKITQPEDLALADFYLQQRAKERS
ncbi:2-C-methyl-D-erythritol 4-phosphate cytidylyltransferase [Thaumasiovibrio sp. DFM-14]|uniref:2-C-methyl-D-erythritol 4-phosphate cytidylyltransferase n=1 Tax=Thaumasiovibrio sp. DFM-14 TaxID=3384792 RepID=UPI0039A16BD0